MLRALKQNEIVCLLSDRDIGGGGVEVEFFGERTTLPGGPATLAAAHGRADPAGRRVLHAARDGHLGVVRPPIPCERRGNVPRGRRPRHAVPRPGARVPHPPCPRAVAPLPAELAQRPGVRDVSEIRPPMGCQGPCGPADAHRSASNVTPMARRPFEVTAPTDRRPTSRAPSLQHPSLGRVHRRDRVPADVGRRRACASSCAASPTTSSAPTSRVCGRWPSSPSSCSTCASVPSAAGSSASTCSSSSRGS